MRRFLSIVLLLVFGLSLVPPLLAHGMDDAGLPSCCRRAGQHHCAMRMDAASADTSQAPVFRSSDGTCPYCPQFATAAHLQIFSIGRPGTGYVAVVSHPASSEQTESMWRMARDRSRQKRGPPSLG